MEGVVSTVENIDAVTARVKVTIPAVVVAKRVEDELNKLMKNLRVDGFRPGKAPRQLVERMHGERVKYEVANKLISSTLYDTITEKKLEVIGEPEVDLPKLELGQSIEFSANVALFPTPTIIGYEDVAAQVENKLTTDEDVEAAIQRVRDAKATTRKVEGRTVAAMGDVIDATLLIELEGEEPTRPEPVRAALGEGKIPAELEREVVGMEVGQNKDVSITFPEDHTNKQLAGKKSLYRVTLNSLFEKVLPEVTDEWVVSLGDEKVKTQTELRAAFRTELEKFNENDQKTKAYQAILDQLLEKNEFLVPQVMIDDEIKEMLVRANVLDPNKVKVNEIRLKDEIRTRFGDAAKKRVRTAVLVDRVAIQEKIEVTEEDQTKIFQDIAAQHNVPLEIVLEHFKKERSQLRGVFLEQQRNKVLEFLYGKAKIEKVAMGALSTSDVQVETAKAEVKPKAKAKAGAKSKAKAEK